MYFVMPVIRQVLQKFGYVKLADFGLLLDADDRIVSVQNSSLIDASGGRVVGWRSDDIGPMVLPRWPGPASPGVVTLAAPAAISRGAGLVAPHVPPAVALDEDEWEWTIALARARAAPALQVQAQPPPLPALQPQARPSPSSNVAERFEMPRRSRAQTVPPPVAPHHVGFVTADTVVQPGLAASSVVPSIRASTDMSPRRAAVTVSARAGHAVPPPVPIKVAAALHPQQMQAFQAAPPRRFPKGTEPLDQVALRAKLAQPLPPPRPRASTMPLGATRS